MPGATRVGDIHASGDDRDPSALQTGSPSVFINGKAAGRVGDAYENGHAISAGAPHVFINGRAAARVGDAVSCGGTVREGSSSVIIGNSGGDWLIDKRYRRVADDLAGKDLSITDQSILCLPSEAASKAEGEQGPNGWLYLSSMLKKWISLEANADPWRREISPFYVSMDWILSKSTGQAAFADLSSRMTNDAALEALGRTIAGQIESGALPDGGGEWIPFDFINVDPHEIREKSSQYASASPSAISEQELYAAMGEFTLRGLAAGQYQVISGNIFIQFEQAAAVVLDTFNFDGDAFLRVWYCAATGGVPLYNSSFRSFSERHGQGGAFIVVSEPQVISGFNSVSFEYKTDGE